MFSTPEFKVGVLVVAISSLIGVMSLRVSEGPGVLGGSKDLWFDIKDAGGLVKNSAVKMAGIKVGVIEDIELHNGEARVRLKLRSDVPVSVSGSVEVRADGILGDKHVELLPGKVGDPMMADGQQIQQVISNGSLDDLVKEVTEIAGSIKKLARSLNEAVEGQGDSSTTVGRILINLDKLTKDLSEISGDNKQKIGEIVDQVNSITRKLDEVINESNMASFENTLKNIEDVLAQHDMTLQNVVKCTVILANIDDFGKMNGIYRQFFKDNLPARTTFAANLVAGASIEIEVVAAK